MTDNFDWQTEDDSGWDKVEEQPQTVTEVRRRPWTAVVVVLLLLSVAALVAYWQFNRRLETLTAAIEADVLSSHNLVNRAAAGHDLELLAPLLSAREPAWTDTYEALLEKGLFYDRSPFSLPLASTSEAYADLSLADDRYVRIEVAPDMNAAELHFLEEHDPGAGEEEVMLEHTAVYRRGRTRWLLAPPDDEFWGSWQSMNEDHLTVIYPERDAEIAEQLAEDLKAVIADVCQQISPVTCADDLRLTLRLDSEPDSLLDLTDPAHLYDGNLRLNLPAPTLVGLPVDEKGYQALFRGYGAAVASALITYQVGWECCAHAPFYQAFLEYQLSEMQLRPWPVSTATHTQVINSGITEDVLFNFWRESSFQSLSEVDGWQLYAFVDFFMHQSYAPDPVSILISLNEPHSLSQWLASLVEAQPQEGNMVQERLLRDWWLYAHTQMIADQGPLPIPLPEQDLLLTCSTDMNDIATSRLYRYRTADASWQEESALQGLMFASPLPDDEAVILQTILTENETYVPLRWRDGVGYPVINDSYPVALSWGQVDPLGQQLLVYSLMLDDGEELQNILVDLTACDPDGCPVTIPTGNPIWSPDGSQTLLTSVSFLRTGMISSSDSRVMMFIEDAQTENSVLYRGDNLGNPETAQPLPPPGGNAPFWVNNEMYGYIQTINPSFAESEQQIVLASTSDDVPQPLLETNDLLSALPDEVRPFRLSISAVLAHPTQPEWLVVMATSRAKDFIFLVNWQDNVIDYRFNFSHVNPQYLAFSPDGRYLLTTGSPEANFFTPEEVFAYFLHDIAANKTQTYMAGSFAFLPAYTFDWSGDGRWLAQIMNNGIINLVAPDYNYQTLILHDNGNCTSLAWVNP